MQRSRLITDLQILDDVVYALENREHKAIAFKIEFPQIKHDFDIGRFGQGPGELQFPLSLSIWKNEIAIKDQNAISFFDKNGEFSGRFNVLSNQKGYLYKDKIYFANHAYSRENGEQTIIEIRSISINSMSLLEKHFILRKGLCRLDSIVVFEKSGEDYILISLDDFSEGRFLEIYI